MSTRLLILPLVATLASCSARRPVAGDGGTGSDVPPDANPACTQEGEHWCDGLSYMRCQGGSWVLEVRCNGDQVCTSATGCTTCEPGGLGCQGDLVVQCDAAGNPTSNVVADCSPTTCVAGACASACSPEALSRSYSGCVFYAVDLPQWAQPSFLPGFTTTAADQQFAIAVANSSDAIVDVVVERSDAPPGGAPALVEVARTTVAPASLQVVPLPQREVSGYVLAVRGNASRLDAASYRVTTSRPTTVYQFNPQNNPNAFSNDASLLIPANALDESYVVLGWPGMGGVSFFGMSSDNRSYVTIVGTQPNTRIRVVPSTHVMAGDGVPALAPGEELLLTLGEFETINLEGANYDVYGDTDFTGTRIEADKPVVVFSGNECINVVPPPLPPPMSCGDGFCDTGESCRNCDADCGGCCCCDHLEEQLFPRSSLGGEYVAVRSQPRGSVLIEPDYFRVLALDDATAVTTSLPAPNDSFMLMRGQMREILADVDFTVDSTGPVMVGQYLVSQMVTENVTGDPAFILVPPIAQFRTRYIFLVPSGYGTNYVLLSVPAGETPTLDGAPIAGCSRTLVGAVSGVTYEAHRCPVDAGTHTIAAGQPFGLVVEGLGPGPVSYGYTGGMDFENVNAVCSVDAQCGTGEFCSGGACVAKIIL